MSLCHKTDALVQLDTNSPAIAKVACIVLVFCSLLFLGCGVVHVSLTLECTKMVEVELP
jgi:hypothetical protein